MDRIEHKFLQVRGLKLHVAEIGAGDKAIVFMHGFPEIWYSWRHQMVAMANAGFRAIAPDHRGYGLSDPPPEPAKSTFGDIILDLLGILDTLQITKVVLVAKDFGASPAYLFTIMYPERVLGVVSMGAPFSAASGSSRFLDSLPEGFYMARWQEPGRAEADFGRFDAKTVVRKIYTMFSGSEIPIAAEKQEIMDLVDVSAPLPPWFTEEDLAAYGALYEKSGFQTALKVPYRLATTKSFGFDCMLFAGHLMKSSTYQNGKVPTLLITGGKYYALKFPGMEDYIRGRKIKEYVPNLEIVHLPEGSHFVQEQFPDQVNQLMFAFLNAHIWS